MTEDIYLFLSQSTDSSLKKFKIDFEKGKISIINKFKNGDCKCF